MNAHDLMFACLYSALQVKQIRPQEKKIQGSWAKYPEKPVDRPFLRTRRNYKILRPRDFIDRSAETFAEEFEAVAQKVDKRLSFEARKERKKRQKMARQKRIEGKLSGRKAKGSVPAAKPETRAEWWEYKLRI